MNELSNEIYKELLMDNGLITDVPTEPLLGKEQVISITKLNESIKYTSDVIMKPSPEELEALKNEYDHVNTSCTQRLEEEQKEDIEIEGSNKRKKNRPDTLYRTKFGAKSSIE
ncbi:hypothetical protein RclHR1_15060004 [Rhizophagus clarus]|uniref:Uncharacterized protein n=1 Tax=Rhizophagus clarus TaxID=94130 RepID=A0A2Z6QEB8_9GLOM|nr:hypothetical protein RclHR1_15060004 [Rhizophagus clarus]GES79954.1 hypothetical protein RCL_jg23704.t1 [Rhizophagus clarus]